MPERDLAGSRPPAWGEKDSAVYRSFAPVAVPDREIQLATLLCLLPFDLEETFATVDLGCGEGALSAALLDCFANASVVGVDGSSSMRDRARERLAPFGKRAAVGALDLHASAWPIPVDRPDCVLSSLVVHHLDGPGKRRFFDAARAHIASRGALLIADLVEPRRHEARSLWAESWDRAARTRSRELLGSDDAFEEFVAAQWNWFRWPDPADIPSPLGDQLEWLSASGFEAVDCFWMQAGHAIYGGYGPEAVEPKSELKFGRAIAAANSALTGSF
jgi:tRNA (cmo5U34)-methyltransferase